MAVTPPDGLFGLTILIGVVLCSLGVYCYRRWEEPGVAPFAAVAVILGVTGIVGGAVGIAHDGSLLGETLLWRDIAMTGWSFAMIPWILFALQYTGRYTRFRLRTIAAIAVPVVGLPLLLWIQSFPGVESGVLFPLVGTFGLLYVLALVIIGSYLLLRTTAEYGHLSVYQGVCVALVGISPVFLVNYIGALAGEIGALTAVGVYTAAFLTPTVALLLAIFRYDMFDSTPAAGTLGERAIPRETDDLVFVVDREGRIIQINETATETLDVAGTQPLGSPLAELLGVTVAELARKETVALETSLGKRRFDPQVSAFTDQHDRQLGHLLSLRDVTARELRKQRLEVLNRVLRHNLSNKVDIIKSNAEAISPEANDEFVESIQTAADDLASLSSKARETDRLVSRPVCEGERDVVTVVRELVEEHAAAVDSTIHGPESAPLVTDWDALRPALDSAIANACEYAEESVSVTIERLNDGYMIIVADDGSGIPESELASLDAETETALQHGTGLGLWQVKWGITKIGGELSFDTTRGTTVRMTVPSQTA